MYLYSYSTFRLVVLWPTKISKMAMNRHPIICPNLRRVLQIFFTFPICFHKCESIDFLKSTQYKNLAPNALRFTYYDLKSFKSHEKHETKNIRLLVFSFSPTDVFCLIFSCCLQDFKFWFVNRKAFGIRILYWVDFTICDKKGVFLKTHIFVIQLQFVTNSYLKTLITKIIHYRKKLEDL